MPNFGNIISSRQNEVVKKFRKVFSGMGKHFPTLFAIEGIKLIQEALKEDVDLETVLIGEGLLKDAAVEPALWRELELRHLPVLVATDAVMASVSAVAADQGILALGRRRRWPPEALFPERMPALIAVACGIQDPGNLGTLIRTCDATRCTGMISYSGTVDPYHAKVVRASMGSVFRVPVVETRTLAESLALVKARSLQIIATATRAPVRHLDVDFTKPVALLFGNEGQGLPEEAYAAADQTIGVPISDRVDSLNVGIAAAIVLYEAFRQRSTF
jgi:TrmH family RNA methyltransferase